MVQTVSKQGRPGYKAGLFSLRAQDGARMVQYHHGCYNTIMDAARLSRRVQYHPTSSGWCQTATIPSWMLQGYPDGYNTILRAQDGARRVQYHHGCYEAIQTGAIPYILYTLYTLQDFTEIRERAARLFFFAIML